MAAAKKQRGPLDAEAVIGMATRRETSVPLCLAGHLQGEYEVLERQLADAAATVGQSLAGTNRADIAQRMEAVREEMAEHLVVFRLRALAPATWSDLVAAHPGRTSAHAFDEVTLGPAAIAACLVDPVMSVEQYGRLAERLTSGQQDALLNATWSLNTEAAQRVPFSLLASATAGSLTGER
ncbi:hypothetical protein [Kitasatospora sp. CB02891]|uniref:hypothetical protein n=1 Tax=Kitasatospora sp. CB02891 TaxID=2020329 RepID=UPI000C26E093|nr:hypothetical protein [Kitasatospora sp. CB02891]PJN24064.1 hypothetical protein CG736_19405 [Kitasatospora sp. CB02891]